MLKSRKNKRGVEFSVTTLLVIVLGILVLAILAMGVGFGFGNFWERVTGYFSGAENVDVVKEGCAVACSTASNNAWCNQERPLRYLDGSEQKKEISVTCESFAKRLPVKDSNNVWVNFPSDITENMPACPARTCPAVRYDPVAATKCQGSFGSGSYQVHMRLVNIESGETRESTCGKVADNFGNGVYAYAIPTQNILDLEGRPLTSSSNKVCCFIYPAPQMA